MNFRNLKEIDMKKFKVFTMMLVMMCALIGCSGEGGSSVPAQSVTTAQSNKSTQPVQPDPATSQTTQPDTSSDTIENYAADYEISMNKGDADLFMSRVSKNVLNDGQDYSCQNQVWIWLFDNYLYSSTNYEIEQPVYQNKDGKQFAVIHRTVSYTQVSKFGKETKAESTGDITLILENGKWKFFGNQKGYSSPSVSKITTFERIDESTGNPIGVKTKFSGTDDKVMVQINIDNAYNGSVFSVRCYKPNGTIFSETPYTVSYADYPKCVRFATNWYQSYTFPNYIGIPGFEAKDNVGTWRIEVFSDELGTIGRSSFEYVQ
jgi:hypothetical protein